jgi:putative oxidoreductase
MNTPRHTPATLDELGVLLGRAGLAAIFIHSGWGKLGGYAATLGYMEAMGVSGALLPLVIAAELLGGLAVLSGTLTRWAALGLAVFALLSGILFHGNVADQNQFIHLMKNVAIAGGFLVLAAHGAGRFSIDHWRRRAADARLAPVPATSVREAA